MNNDKPHRVALCITTYKRPVLLSRCLLAINSIEVSQDLRPVVLVVDNDCAGSAEKVCTDAAENILFALYYCIEPRPGLCFGRNRLLQQARKHKVDFIAFIDDDEMPHRDWLENIYQGLISRDADIVTGPVISTFETTPPKKFFTKEKYRLGEKVRHVGSGNVLFKIRLVSELGLMFDNYYNFIGSEDYDFFDRAKYQGCQVAYVANAVMFEFVSPERRTLRYTMYRHYSGGIGCVLHHKHRCSTAIVWLFFIPRLLAKLASAVICFFCAAVPGKQRSYLKKAAIKLASAIGYIAGLFNIVEERYRLD